MSLYSSVLLLLPVFSFAQTIVVATQVVTASPSAATSSSQYTSDSDFQSSILNSTNTFRSEHNATALTWNTSLATYASDYANNCVWQHSGGPYGENLAQGYGNVTDAVDAWGDEQDDYDYNNPGFSEQTGHFTQLVWKSTTTVGCGRTYCNGKSDVSGWYLVCEYYPRGNVIGAFGTEVDPEEDDDSQCDPAAGCMSVAGRLSIPKWWIAMVIVFLVFVL